MESVKFQHNHGLLVFVYFPVLLKGDYFLYLEQKMKATEKENVHYY